MMCTASFPAPSPPCCSTGTGFAAKVCQHWFVRVRKHCLVGERMNLIPVGRLAYHPAFELAISQAIFHSKDLSTLASVRAEGSLSGGGPPPSACARQAPVTPDGTQSRSVIPA
jgi:hypothetical protein